MSGSGWPIFFIGGVGLIVVGVVSALIQATELFVVSTGFGAGFILFSMLLLAREYDKKSEVEKND